MTPQELKNSILQLAIQGKLVPQRPEEGNAEDLYKQIQAEKQKLIKEGKIKKEKPLPPITDNEKPFEIPASWKWVRLYDILDVRDGTHDTPKYVIKGIPLVTSKNLINNTINFETAKLISIEDAKYINTRSVVDTGDILFAMIGTIGNPVLVKKDREFCIKNMALFKPIDCKLFEMLYLFWYLQKEQDSMKKKASGGVQSFVSLKYLRNYLLPLPPLAEQKRIVAKIEEILPYVERYEAAYYKLQQLNKRFPDDLQKSVLQLAIQGRLVPQRAEEGNAEDLYKQIQTEKQKLIKEGKIKKEKLLPPITDDEKPFEIPDSWKWVRLNELCKSISDGDHQPPPQVSNGYPFLVISNISSGKIDFSNTRYVSESYFNSLPNERVAKKGDILFTVTGSLGIPIKVEDDKEFCFQRHIALLKVLIKIDCLNYFLRTPMVQLQCNKVATGTAQKTIGLKSLRNLLIPLPPLAEQKRIVAKIEELLPLCDKLK